MDDLIENVCHDEQLEVWADEMMQELMEQLAVPPDYEAVIDLRRALKRAAKHVAVSALSHPAASPQMQGRAGT